VETFFEDGEVRDTSVEYGMFLAWAGPAADGASGVCVSRQIMVLDFL